MNNSPLDPSRAPQFLDDMLKRNNIVIISATYCSFCLKVKTMLIQLKRRFVSLEVDIIPNGREVFKEVVARTGVHTVPQVFSKGKYIGGYDDLIALYKSNALERTLDKENERM